MQRFGKRGRRNDANVDVIETSLAQLVFLFFPDVVKGAVQQIVSLAARRLDVGVFVQRSIGIQRCVTGCPLTLQLVGRRRAFAVGQRGRAGAGRVKNAAHPSGVALGPLPRSTVGRIGEILAIGADPASTERSQSGGEQEDCGPSSDFVHEFPICITNKKIRWPTT